LGGFIRAKNHYNKNKNECFVKNNFLLISTKKQLANKRVTVHNGNAKPHILPGKDAKP